VARSASGTVSEQLRAQGVQVDLLGGSGFFDFAAFARGIRIAREFRPHIVHGAVFEGVGLAVALGWAVGAKVVVEETSHAVNRSRSGHALFRALASAADACVAISPAVADYLETVTRVPKSKIVVIENGTNSPTVSPETTRASARAAFGLPASAFVLGSVCRLVDDSNKRVSDLIRALALLVDSPVPVWLLVVGDGLQRPMLEQLARDLGVQDRVVFAGHRDDVGNCYAAMDAFALVSRNEGFGLVAPEAMFCSLPVIATRVGGLVGIVVDGETGILIPPATPTAIADAVRRLSADPGLCDKMGRAGRERAKLRFSAERYAADVDQFYRRLLAPRGPGRASLARP
jgi:glycosyltransferase involved in cell wall biosynthesis